MLDVVFRVFNNTDGAEKAARTSHAKQWDKQPAQMTTVTISSGLQSQGHRGGRLTHRPNRRNSKPAGNNCCFKCGKPGHWSKNSPRQGSSPTVLTASKGTIRKGIALSPKGGRGHCKPQWP